MIADSVRGSIVNVSSQASLSGLLDHTVYAATKGAMDAASRVMAVELGERRCGEWEVVGGATKGAMEAASRVMAVELGESRCGEELGL